MKVAKLVTASVMTRVVVDSNATQEQIIEAAKGNLVRNLNDNIHDNVEEVVDDIECPYSEPEDDAC